MKRAHCLRLLAAIPILTLCCCVGVGLKLADNIIEFRNLPTDSTVARLTFDGRNRSYRLYVPTNLPPKIPLVFVLHGGGGDALGMERLTLRRFNRLADQNGFIVVYPDGIDKHWNDGRGLNSRQAQRQNVDDVAFISTLIDQLATLYPIDRTRVFATGISNGGMMSFRLACDLSTEIAAVAPVVANLSDKLADQCSPARPIPILIMNGTADPLVRWNGGERRVFFQSLGELYSFDETVSFWRTSNGCPDSPLIERLPDSDPNDGTRVRREVYAPCQATLVLYIIEDGGHTWPRGFQYLDEWLVGRTSQDIDASRVIWEFFAMTQ